MVWPLSASGATVNSPLSPPAFAADTRRRETLGNPSVGTTSIITLHPQSSATVGPSVTKLNLTLSVSSITFRTTTAVSSSRPSLIGPWLIGLSRRPSSSTRLPLCSTKPTKWRSTSSSRFGVAVWPDSAAWVWADSTAVNWARSAARSRGVWWRWKEK